MAGNPPLEDHVPPRPVKWADLGVRTTVGVVLIAGGIVEIWLGGWAFSGLAAIVSGLVAREWMRLVGWQPAAQIVWAGVCAAVIIAAKVFEAFLPLALGSVVLGLIALALAPAYAHRRLSALGPVYAIVPVLALVWLRGLPDGLVLVAWLVAAVVATDIGAYFAGRMIGGPRLAPKLSPKKTWAGLGGGMLAAGLVGLGFALVWGPLPVAWAFGLSAVLAAVAQAGDIAESGLKRRFGVKDSGTLLPGHGGVMDRLDGLLAAAPVVAAGIWLIGTRGIG